MSRRKNPPRRIQQKVKYCFTTGSENNNDDTDKDPEFKLSPDENPKMLKKTNEKRFAHVKKEQCPEKRPPSLTKKYQNVKIKEFTNEKVDSILEEFNNSTDESFAFRPGIPSNVRSYIHHVVEKKYPNWKSSSEGFQKRRKTMVVKLGKSSFDDAIDVSSTYESDGDTILIWPYGGHKIKLKEPDLETLKGENWYNDVVIDAIILYLEHTKLRTDHNNERIIKLHDTLFYKDRVMKHPAREVTSWLKEIKPVHIIPVNTGTHWYLTVISLLHEIPQIHVCDSMKPENGRSVSKELRKLAAFMQAEKISKEVNEDEVEIFHPLVTQQNDNFNCGVHLLQNIDAYVSMNIQNFIPSSSLPVNIQTLLTRKRIRDIFDTHLTAHTTESKEQDQLGELNSPVLQDDVCQTDKIESKFSQPSDIQNNDFCKTETQYTQFQYKAGTEPYKTPTNLNDTSQTRGQRDSFNCESEFETTVPKGVNPNLWFKVKEGMKLLWNGVEPVISKQYWRDVIQAADKNAEKPIKKYSGPQRIRMEKDATKLDNLWKRNKSRGHLASENSKMFQTYIYEILKTFGNETHLPASRTRDTKIKHTLNLNEEEWKEIFERRNYYILNKKLYPLGISCVLRFYSNPKGHPYRYANCTFNNCYTFAFVRKGDYTVEMTVNGEFNHNENECHSRQLRGDRRRELGKQTAKHGATFVNQELEREAGKKYFAQKVAGNDSEVPTEEVLRKAASEFRKSERNDPNLFEDLDLERRKSKLKDTYSKTVKGFIQQISIYPFRVMFIWEHAMWKYKELGGVIHLDATGKICQKVGDTKVYIYVVVAKAKEHAPYELGLLLTDRHTTVEIDLFLGEIKRTFCEVNGGRPMVTPACVSDFSWVFVNSECLIFNKLSVKLYLNLIWKHLNQSFPLPKDLTLLYICKAHLMNSIRRLAAKHGASKNLRIMCLCFMAKIIEVRTLVEYFDIWKEFCVILHAKFPNPDIAKFCSNIKDALEFEESEEGNSHDEHDITENLNQEFTKYVDASNFGKRAKKIYEKAKKEANDIPSKSASNERSEFYNPKLLKSIMTLYMPLAPLLAPQLTSNESYSNAVIESVIKKLKISTLQNKTHIYPPDLVRILISYLETTVTKDIIYLRKKLANPNEVPEDHRKRSHSQKYESKMGCLSEEKWHRGPSDKKRKTYAQVMKDCPLHRAASSCWSENLSSQNKNNDQDVPLIKKHNTEQDSRPLNENGQEKKQSVLEDFFTPIHKEKKSKLSTKKSKKTKSTFSKNQSKPKKKDKTKTEKTLPTRDVNHGSQAKRVRKENKREEYYYEFEDSLFESEDNFTVGERNSLTGIVNLGNTCYLNSVIQLLARIPPLVHLLIGCVATSPILSELSTVVNSLLSSSEQCINIAKFKNIIGQSYEMFRKYDQQDAEEALRKILMLSFDDKKYGTQLEELFLIHQEQIMTLTCDHKGGSQPSTEIIRTLTLPNDGVTTSIQKCMDDYLAEEKNIIYKCENCYPKGTNYNEDENGMRVSKRHEFTHLPNVLLLNIVRFYNESDSLYRNNTAVVIDNTLTIKQGEVDINYELISVLQQIPSSTNQASIKSGHYITYCYIDEHKKWFKFDDNHVSENQPQSPCSFVYVACYLKKNFP